MHLIRRTYSIYSKKYNGASLKFFAIQVDGKITFQLIESHDE
ncbi:hypothetical protein BNJ_00025 [Kaumoebavirus]|nr:hypothetical protein BNJ_00025 [Kaumoebavirus]ARA71868.1 hypothetical protein BNJ_00025 [Kaumoebavirus]